MLKKLVLGLVAILGLAGKCQGDILMYGTSGSVLSQNFDGLNSTGTSTWTNDTTIPGWVANRTGTGTTIIANTGSTNIGGLYSLGGTASIDRSLGSIGSSTVGNFTFGVAIQNTTGQGLDALSVGYTGEQWRFSGETAVQVISFEYKIGSLNFSNFGDGSGWTGVSSLNFSSPIISGSTGALDGNLSANRLVISPVVIATPWANGDVLLLRWLDPDHSGSDHGLAMDDFSITAVPEPNSIALISVTGCLGFIAAFRRRKPNSIVGSVGI